MPKRKQQAPVPPIPLKTDSPADKDAEALKRPAFGAIKPIRGEDEDQVFRFEVGPAILEEVRRTLLNMPVRPLTEGAKLAKHPGFYQLFLDGKPVYIGKTSRPIRTRLGEHAGMLSRRLKIKRVTCRYVYVEDPSLIDVAEGALIKFFEVESGWNTSGFGSKATGAHCGGQEKSLWDQHFPPDFNVKIPVTTSAKATLRGFVRILARQAPVVVSIPQRHLSQFETDHPQLIGAIGETRTFEEWCVFLRERLAPGWEIDRRDKAFYIRPKGSA